MNAVSDAPVHWDPYNPKYFANPYPVFRRLREEAPCYYNAELSSTSTVRGWETLPAYTPKAAAAGRPRFHSARAAQPQAAPAIPGAEVWNMTLKTPMGPQEMTMQIVRDGQSFSGRIESPMGSEPVNEGKITGEALSWVMEVKKPMPLKVSFEVKVSGDTMSGHAKLGMMGKAAITGKRI